MERMNSLMAQKNAIEAQIIALQEQLTIDNAVAFVEEVLNLLSGVGEGYVAGDYYAPNRYYSKINGVKNICMMSGEIWVKVTTPSGYLLPDVVRIGSDTYAVIFDKSSKFDYEVDY